ncbi:unnamed protein product, partial [Effrenium voratum]
KKELLQDLFDLGDQVVRAREEDAGDAEAEDGLESGRDRSKAQKFKKMLAEESLPAAVLAEYQSCGSRDDKTKLINTLFVKEGGALKLRPEKLTFSTQKRLETTDSKAEKEKGIGKNLFMSKWQIKGQAVEFDEDQFKEVKKLWSKMTPEFAEETLAGSRSEDLMGRISTLISSCVSGRTDVSATLKGRKVRAGLPLYVVCC